MIFQNASVFCQGTFQALDVEISHDTIIQVASHISGNQTVDCCGKLLLPGLIDIHSHGCIGYDFSTANSDEIKAMLSYYAAHGITSVAATTMTMEKGHCRTAVSRIGDAAKSSSDAARIIGINLEGPFLGKEKKGAHDERYLIPIDREYLDELDRLSDGHLLLIDLDPTLDGALEMIRAQSPNKIFSLAHTACNYETALRAFECGANHITHLFNAMNGLHHRNPGIIGALNDRSFFAEIISDGIHIHPSVLRLMFSLCPEKLVLISDSMSACGLSDGNYTLGGLPVAVQGQKATLKDSTIAGSVTNLFDGMKKAIRFGIKKEDAILSATFRAAQSVRMEHQIGSIEPGKKADLVITDENLSIQSVYCGGKAV